MQNYYVTTGTVTYAIKGRDILRKYGIKASVARKSKGVGSSGCGYNIVIENGDEKALSILKASGIKILEIYN